MQRTRARSVAQSPVRLPLKTARQLAPAAIGVFCLGLAAGLGATSEMRAAALTALLGGLLLCAFRALDQRARTDDRRIAALEGDNRALEEANERLGRYHRDLEDLAASRLSGLPAADDHTSPVCELAEALGREMGLGGGHLAALRAAARLHDLGRLDCPSDPWARAGSLTDEDWEWVRRHPVLGARRLEDMAFPWPVAEIVRHQMERWDGRGHPGGLFGEETPLGSRILAVADAYHAMRTWRPYRPPMEHAEALATLRHDAGRRFDPRVVDAFTRLAARGEFLEAAPQLEAIARERVL